MKMKWDSVMIANRAILADRLVPETATMRIVKCLAMMDAIIWNINVNDSHGIRVMVSDYRRVERGFYDLVFTRAGTPIPRFLWK